MRILTIALLSLGPAFAAGRPQTAVPLFFIPNTGQGTPGAGYLAKGSGLTASFSPDGVTFLMGSESVRMEFEGANARRRLEGGERLPGSVNFLRGDPGEWRSGIPMFGSVVYRDLYSGIDMV